MMSSRAAELSRSIPGRRPRPLNVGKTILLFRAGSDLRRLITSLSASSITAVRDRPESAANFFASVSKASSRRTVVLMHQDISDRHQNVKVLPSPHLRRNRLNVRAVPAQPFQIFRRTVEPVAGFEKLPCAIPPGFCGLG